MNDLLTIFLIGGELVLLVTISGKLLEELRAWKKSN